MRKSNARDSEFRSIESNELSIKQICILSAFILNEAVQQRSDEVLKMCFILCVLFLLCVLLKATRWGRWRAKRFAPKVARVA